MATVKQTLVLQDKMSSTLSKVQQNALNNIKTFNKMSKEVDDLKKALEEAEKVNPEIVKTEMYAQSATALENMEDKLYDAAQGNLEVKNTNDQVRASATELNQSLELLSKGWQLVGKAVQEAQQWIQTANNQFTSEFTAGTSMSAMMGMDSKGIQDIYDYAAALQQVGVLGDEALISGAGIMSSAATGSEGLKGLMEAAANATVANEGLNASQASFESTSNQLRRALEGSASMLVRNNILTQQQADYIDNINDRAKKEAELIRLVNLNTGEANKMLAQTSQGGMMQATNALGDMQEQLGNAVLPYFAAFQQMLVQILQPIVDFATANSQWLIPIIIALTGAIGGIIIGLTIYKIATLGALKATLALIAPFLPFIALIVGFIAAINLAAQALSKWSRTSVSAIGLVFGAISTVIVAVENLFIILYDVLQGIIDGIALLFIGLADVVLLVLTGIAAGIDAVFGSNLTDATIGAMKSLNSAGKAIIEDPRLRSRKKWFRSIYKRL